MKMVALYKRIRPTIQTGNLYRLLSPRTSEITANEYVSSDGMQTVLFVFRHSQQFPRKYPPFASAASMQKASIGSNQWMAN